MKNEDEIDVIEQLHKNSRLWLRILVISVITLAVVITVSLCMRNVLVLIIAGVPIGSGLVALVVYKDYREGLQSFRPKESNLE